MLWINEGFVLDDAGNMLTTSSIDLREEAERTVIRSLVKGCRREHALEDGKTLLISKPERFREYGVVLIRDEQEGFARKRTWRWKRRRRKRRRSDSGKRTYIITARWMISGEVLK